MTAMRTIKFDAEDSKVSEILQALLNSGVAVKNVEVTNTQHSKAITVSESSVIEASGPSFTLYRHSHLVGQNEGISTTDVISGVKFVGGTIFYIDDAADGRYQFFDADGNVIENVQIGDRPYYYRVIKKGFKDKYYVYHDEIYDNMRWTYCKDGVYVHEPLGTFTYIGSGRINTETVMTKDNGVYITMDSNGYPTIWHQLQQVRNAKIAGCDDWFVPSMNEIEFLRLAAESRRITGGKIAGASYRESIFSKRLLWSSSEYLDQNARFWGCYSQGWNYSCKDCRNSVFFVRAF